jgi:hypothetical protein
VAKIDTKTGRVTVQKGDSPAKIAKDLSAQLKEKVTTKQVQQAIAQNKTLAARQKAGTTVLFSGTTFKFNSGISQQQLANNNQPPPDTNYSNSEPVVQLPPPPPQMVRVPERDVVSLAQETVSAETITNLLFENVGANELTKFVRHDTVEGINPYYDVISNLSDIKRKFDPSNLISLQKTNSSFFDIFPINLQDKIPSDAYLLENNLTDYVYIDTNGDFVIEVVNLKDSEIVEIEIDTSGTIFEVDEL